MFVRMAKTLSIKPFSDLTADELYDILARIILHSQTRAIPFYERCGYAIISKEFLKEGIPIT